MSIPNGVSTTDRALLARVARLHYFESRSKSEIGQELNLSRFKVARLIDEARTSGVVTITIDESGRVDPDLSQRLAAHLGLARCVVVDGRNSIPEMRSDVGGAAAILLKEAVQGGDTVGMAWGRTITAMTEHLTELPSVNVVALTGTVGSDVSESPVEVLRRVSESAGGKAHAIFAPLVLDDALTASTLRRQPDIARVIEYFDVIDVAVLAVGSWDPPISQLRDALPPYERDEFEAQGVVAEVGGTLITENGGLLPGFAERCLTISTRQLARVPRVIAVAAEAEKARAVHAVAQSALITDLVTGRRCAEAMLQMPFIPQRDHAARAQR
ncbi:sugar-binding transcriptional regulator [Brachybacterium sp. AOP29-B2-41]|uniref:sugar-binding transcriptional regulator n=1 Tax=Brachybacterium sp. AOP29-B2-41 TaxID=3457704 RepID=UPI0040331E8E